MSKLWTHQQQAVDFVEALDGRAMIAMEMGTGKSLTAIELLRRWHVKRALILCPKSVVAVWPKEFEKHVVDPTAWHVLALDRGTCKQRAAEIGEALVLAERLGRRLVVVLNYEAATEAAIANTLQTMPWDAIIADECHRLKDPTGKRSKFIAKMADRCPRRLGLTGTPCPHSPLDLWAQFRFIDKSVFNGATYHQFRYRYAIMGGFQDKQVVSFQRMDELTAKFHEHAFRVRTEDVLDLPPFVDVRRTCLLDAKSRSLYDRFEKDLIAEIDGGVVTAGNALVKLLRLSQFTSGFYLDDVTGTLHELGGEKRELLLEAIAEVQAQRLIDDDQLGPLLPPDADAEPVVVFGRFHKDLDTIHEVSRELGLSSSELSGRRNELAAWQDGGSDVLAVQLQAGGLGVDLTRARVCVYYSLNYSLGDYMQTRARIRRPGQNRPVTYVHLLAARSIDEVVYRALEQREEVVKSVVDALKGRRPASARSAANRRNARGQL